MMLIEFARDGCTNLTGIDYSSNAIEWSKQIASDQNLNIGYHVLDMLGIQERFGDTKFDVVHDISRPLIYATWQRYLQNNQVTNT